MTTWRKSSHSGAHDNTDCVELGALTEGIGVRDSKAPETGHHTISREALRGLLVDIKAGKLDL
jgi:hypothetical protein